MLHGIDWQPRAARLLEKMGVLVEGQDAHFPAPFVGQRLGPGGIYVEFRVRHDGTLSPAVPTRSHHVLTFVPIQMDLSTIMTTPCGPPVDAPGGVLAVFAGR